MLFLLVCMYVFLSIVLAVVYHNYQNYMKLETRTMLRNRRANLLSCYEALVAHPEEHITFVRQLRHCSGPFSTGFSALHEPARAV